MRDLTKNLIRLTVLCVLIVSVSLFWLSIDNKETQKAESALEKNLQSFPDKPFSDKASDNKKTEKKEDPQQQARKTAGKSKELQPLSVVNIKPHERKQPVPGAAGPDRLQQAEAGAPAPEQSRNAPEKTFPPSVAAEDRDGDGLTDSEESEQYHTNPEEADTDLDGLSDGDEVRIYKTSPLMKDTDGDGAQDSDEVMEGTDPLSWSDTPKDFAPVEDARDLTVDVADTSATLTFKTNSPRVARILFGQTKLYGSEIMEYTPASEHSLPLMDLQPDTVYHYYIILTHKASEDDETAFAENTYDRTFRTKAAAGDAEEKSPEKTDSSLPGNPVSSLTIRGNINGFSSIKVNGQAPPAGEDKNWEAILPLKKGRNEISLEETAGSNTDQKVIILSYDGTDREKILSCRMTLPSRKNEPARLEGTYEGKFARISVNGKEAKAYTDGTWEGPFIISPEQAGDKSSGALSGDSLTVSGISAEISLKIDDGGRPVDRPLPQQDP